MAIFDRVLKLQRIHENSAIAYAAASLTLAVKLGEISLLSCEDFLDLTLQPIALEEVNF